MNDLPAAEDRAGAGRPDQVSLAALRVHAQALLVSFEAGHPGFVPDGYVGTLDGDVTMIVLELCVGGVWTRVEGGYRVVPSEAMRMAGEVHRETRRDRET